MQAKLAGLCQTRLLLDLFGETDTEALSSGTCCDVCASKANNTTPVKDMRQELAVPIDALQQVGCKGEVKVTEWIRGSKVSWTDKFNKCAMSYGNHCGKSIDFWRLFMKQCSVNNLVRMELRLLIKCNGHYSVYGVYSPTEHGRNSAEESQPVILPQLGQPAHTTTAMKSGPSRRCNSTSDQPPIAKRMRTGKGCHILPVIRSCLKEPENWGHIDSKQDYQFLGVYPHPCRQNIYFIPDVTALKQSSDSLHFLWNDIRFSKGQLNKDRRIEVEVGNKKESVYYRTAPCIVVKHCSVSGCGYVAPVREKRPCPHHTNKLVKTEGYPVEFVYIYPEDEHDK